jgi:hypothetical protein
MRWLYCKERGASSAIPEAFTVTRCCDQLSAHLTCVLLQLERTSVGSECFGAVSRYGGAPVLIRLRDLSARLSPVEIALE